MLELFHGKFSYYHENAKDGEIIMTVENVSNSREIRNVAATMAIENMYLSKAFIEELVKISNGEKTSEQLRQEVIRKYARY